MRKCEIPKPKFDMENILVFKIEGPEPIKGVGKVSEIAIVLKQDGNHEVSYMFEDHDNLIVKQSDIVKRVSM